MLCEVIIAREKESVKSKYSNLSKKDKILSIRKRNSAIRHEYYAIATKYKSWNKSMMSFTIPNVCIKSQNGIKNGRYSKMRVLVQIKSYLAKLLSRESDVKYFMSIEMGKKFSNPHLHIQIYSKSATSSNLINIQKKVCEKFGLNKNRCPITLQDKDSKIDVFHYVIKEYSKNLSDDEIWNLDVQRKRYRKHFGKQIRFYTKSSDKYSKRIYRWCYRLGVMRDRANEWLDFFINNFLVFNKKNLPKVSVFVYVLCQVVIYIIKGFFDCGFIFYVEFAARDPPICFRFYICK